MRWERAVELAAVPAGTTKLVTVEVGARRAATKLLVVHRDDGDLSVIDGRCPHEGYPLSDGYVTDCVLTCAWHNWKFDLRTGDNVLGGEGVTRWPARVVDGWVEVDATGPSVDAEIAGRFASLSTALEEGRLGQALRDTLRLLVAEVPPGRIAAHVARHDALYARWGTTHTLPVAADCARLAGGLEPWDAIERLAPMLDMAVDGTRRLPLRAAPDEAGIEAASAALADGDGGALLCAAVEAEDALGAQALVLAAGRRGIPMARVEAWLLQAVALHFVDFGHAPIYLQKLRELRLLLDDADEGVLVEIAGGLAVSLAYGTREDTLPYMRRWFAGDLPTGEGDLLAALEGGKRGEVLGALGGALAGGTDPVELAEALILGGALRAERFDPAVADDHEVSEDWLSATHRFTASVAIAELLDHVPCSAADAAALLRQGAAFVSLGHATDGAPPAREPVTADWAAPLLAEVLDDRFVRPIRLAHGVKTLVAAQDVMARMGARGEPAVHAVRRFFAVPSRQRRLRNQIHDAVRWLRDGKPPRRLTQ